MAITIITSSEDSHTQGDAAFHSEEGEQVIILSAVNISPLEHIKCLQILPL